MQSSKEQQEEIRKPSSAINAKKQRKQQNGKVQGSLQENQRHQQNFSCKDGQNKGQKWYGLTEEEDIKRRRQEYTGELYKKDLHDPDNHDGVITHLEPDILECEVKWALGSITRNKASGSDGITVELFQILKDDAVKVLHQYDRKFGKLSSGLRTGKGHFSFQSLRKAMPKNAQTIAQLHSSHTLVK